MCGIIGYVGDQQAVPVVLEGLRRLEYRGYDSAGIAVINGGKIEVRRRPGKLQGLLKAIEDEPLEGQTGLGHCLSPDTLIQLADGRILPIGESPNEIEVLSLDLATMRLTPHPAFVFRHQAPENMLEIRAASTGITCTREHRMLIVNPKTGGIEERLARDIKIGDLLLLAKRIPAPPDAQTMSFATTQPRRYWSLSDIGTETLRNTVTASGLNKTELARRAGITDSALRHILVNDRHAREDFLKCICRELDLPFPPNGAAPIHSHHGNFVNLPERATPELMRLVGYFIGDGHAHEHCLRWKDQRRDVLEHYQKIAASLFGLEGRIVHLPDVEAWLLEINSLEMARWFREHFVENREDLFARLGQQSDELIAAFLRGLFDAEGSVACAAGQVSLRMNNILLIRRVQQWLLRFGIITSFYIFPPAPTQKRPNAYAGVFISDAYSMRLFAQVIGFSSTDKLGKLQTVLEGKCADRTRTIKAIPLSAGSLRSWLGKLRVPVSKLQFLRGRDSLSEYRARKLVEELANYPQAQIVRTLLQSYLDGDVFLQKVIIIRDIRNTTPYVYDLEVPDAENFIANGAISHNSRWASHGRPTEENAHPHRDCFGRIVVVHNGIIENYLDLKRELQSQDHIFQTETDTEVVAHLIEKHLSQDPAGGLEAAFRRALAELRGIYALVAMSADEPEKIVAARLGPPIVVGLGDGECFVASDIPALLPYTRDIFYLGDRETVTLTREGARVRDGNGVEIKPQVQRINWDPIQAEKGGFKHFMLKEIYEQPRAIRDTTQGRVSLDTGRVFLDTMAIDRTDFGRFTDIKIAACGTAWHAAMVAKYLIEELARVPVEIDYASEFRYRNPILSPTTLMMVISQSGETADTLAALREAKEKGCRSLAICNVEGSMMTREADCTVYTHAGPEIGVASTKAFTSQMVAAYLFALFLAQERGTLDEEKLKWHALRLAELPVKIEKLLNNPEIDYEELSKKFVLSTDFLYLGRGINFPIALEGALKLKEISYIHAEGYAAGEMKHGPNALIDSRLPVVVINTLDPNDEKSRRRYEKTISNIQEVKARDGIVVAIVTEGDKDTRESASYTIEVPPSSELLSPALSAVPLQLLAYHIAVRRGCDVDQPRNLAKSVTVE